MLHCPANHTVKQLTTRDTRQAIITAWGLLEYQLNVTSDQLAPDQPHGWPDVTRNLEASDKWPMLYPAVLELRRLRNYVAHSSQSPSTADAARYVSTAQDVATTLRTSIHDSALVPTSARQHSNTGRLLSAFGTESDFTQPNLQASYTIPVTVFLSDKDFHQQVEDAVEALLSEAGLNIESRDDPIERSWFRRMKAVFIAPAAREGALGALHIADTKLTLGPDAIITATLMGGISPVLTALQPTKDAVVRLGAVLIVKIDWIVSVNQLTAAQQAILDHRPELASAPREIIQALQLQAPDGAANINSQQPEVR